MAKKKDAPELDEVRVAAPTAAANPTGPNDPPAKADVTTVR